MKYQNKAQFLKRVQSGKIGGIILWQGASLINGDPIVAVACRIAQASGNSKTGDMVQTFILPDPHAAGIECSGSRPAKIMAWLKETGARSICGECPHAWQWDDSSRQYIKGACYVREYQSPAAVLGAVYRGSYPIAGVDFPASWVADCVAGLAVRLGSYGDPAAVPADMWARLISRAKSRTGYTHQWASAFPAARANAYRARGYLMASCDSPLDYSDAIDSGFRAFLVTPKGDASPRPGMMLCPASNEHEARTGKRTNCAKCGACSGAGGKGERMPSVFIPAHGATASRVNTQPRTEGTQTVSKLKINGADYETLKRFVSPYYTAERRAKYEFEGLSRTRYLFDGLYKSGIKIGDGIGTQGDVLLYAYANDDHIKSALSAIDKSC